MAFIKIFMITNSIMTKKIHLDFAWSTQKGFSSLYPLYKIALSRGWNTTLYKIKKISLLNYKIKSSISQTIIIAYDQPLNRLKKSGWNGKHIYIEHGLGAIKYYTYKYNFFHKSELLFYPGPVFERKMKVINPNFKNGLLGGYPKLDDLINKSIDKDMMIKKLKLKVDKPIILFAPSWGAKYNKFSGIWNIDFLNNITNLIAIPHSQDYRYAKKINAIIPSNKEGINPYIKLADIIISDVSSVLAEAAILDKPVIQLKLNNYAGCFPEKDRRKDDIYLSDNFIKNEEKNADLKKRPFKIAYLDEDWIMGEVSYPENIQNAINNTLSNINKFKEKRKYWAKQSCYKCDGKSSLRIAKMIEHYYETGERKQIGELN
tara:strand:+ start:899 stop:2020 length:1122 start_codon:yes stop_codon:yes gene_type:complete